jgi:hypothetical protein
VAGPDALRAAYVGPLDADGPAARLVRSNRPAAVEALERARGSATVADPRSD